MDDPIEDGAAFASPFTVRVQRALRPLVDVRPHEVGTLLASFALFFCLLDSYYLLRPLRDAMGLAGGTGNLPWLFTATFAVMLLGVPTFGALASRLSPRRRQNERLACQGGDAVARAPSGAPRLIASGAPHDDR